MVDKDIDIFGIIEIWLYGNDLDNFVLVEFVFNGYFFGYFVCYDSSGGGVGLMFKKFLNVKFFVVESYNFFEMVNVEIKFVGKLINLYVIYRFLFLSENCVFCEFFLDEFGILLENFVIDFCFFFIIGDFNFYVDNKFDVDVNNFFDLLELFNLC